MMDEVFIFREEEGSHNWEGAMSAIQGSGNVPLLDLGNKE